MNTLRKISTTLAFFLTSSVAFAATDTDRDSGETQLENQMQQVRTETPYGAQTALARPEVGDYGLFFNVSPLYWNAKIDEARFISVNEDNPLTIPVEGPEEGIDFKWRPGLRGSLGYNSEHNGWGFKGQYTRFHTHGSRSVVSKPDGWIIPGIKSKDLSSIPPNFIRSAKSEYNFAFQAIDLEIGRACLIGGKLSLRPYRGLKMVWTDQKQINDYTVSSGTAGHHAFVRVKDNYKSRGLGPCLGLNSKLHLGYGFSIFNNVAGSFLVGSFDAKVKTSVFDPNGNEFYQSLERHNGKIKRLITEVQLGLCYDKWIRNNTQHIGVGLGFERQDWFMEDRIRMYGLTSNIRWDF